MNHEPAALAQMLAAWNESDPARIETFLRSAVTEDVEFVDPNHAVRGISAFRDMIVDFRKRNPKARCVRSSEIDSHHDRARYHWRIDVEGAGFFDGMDAVQFDASGLVRRIDGFFGLLTIERPL